MAQVAGPGSSHHGGPRSRPCKSHAMQMDTCIAPLCEYPCGQCVETGPQGAGSLAGSLRALTLCVSSCVLICAPPVLLGFRFAPISATLLFSCHSSVLLSASVLSRELLLLLLAGLGVEWVASLQGRTCGKGVGFLGTAFAALTLPIVPASLAGRGCASRQTVGTLVLARRCQKAKIRELYGNYWFLYGFGPISNKNKYFSIKK